VNFSIFPLQSERPSYDNSRGSAAGSLPSRPCGVAFVPLLATMHTTSVSLLERLGQSAQTAAWARFAKLYTPLLYYWSRRLGLRDADAADLVQDVFIVLVQKLPEFRYDPRKSFRSWLRTVVVNKYRENRRRIDPFFEADETDLAALPDPNNGGPFWEVEYRHQVVTRAVELMKADFQPATWKACWEHVVSGRSAADVGAELGISEGAVRVAKFRVLARLREELEGLLD
jgi:RNA polymerase sigma-70 factor (ECF subfamily)